MGKYNYGRIHDHSNTPASALSATEILDRAYGMLSIDQSEHSIDQALLVLCRTHFHQNQRYRSLLLPDLPELLHPRHYHKAVYRAQSGKCSEHERVNAK